MRSQKVCDFVGARVSTVESSFSLSSSLNLGLRSQNLLGESLSLIFIKGLMRSLKEFVRPLKASYRVR